MEEIWKPIKHNPNYFVSNLGNIKRVGYKYTCRSRGGNQITVTTRDLQYTPSVINNTGYFSVSIAPFRGHKLLHRLIAEAFIPNPENKRCINHKNGNKLDNRLENLEWVTHGENNLHAYRTGLKKGRSVFGIKNQISKPVVMEDAFGKIKGIFENAREAEHKLGFKVSYKHISAVCTGKRLFHAKHRWHYI